jgi:hypothetical protein
MTEPLMCSECEHPIAEGDAIWWRPFAGSTRDKDGFLTMEPETSRTDNGGLPFHQECLANRLSDEA